MATIVWSTDTVTPPTPTAVAPLYFILGDFGPLGRSYVERDIRHMDWQTTVRHLSEHQVNTPVRVIAVNLAAGTSADVTERAFAAAGLSVEAPICELSPAWLSDRI